MERTLTSVSIFSGVSPDSIRRIEEECVWQAFSVGEKIIHYLDEDDCVYFLTSGQVKVVVYSDAGRIVAFRVMEPGAMFGDLAAIDGLRRSASVEAMTACTLAKMTSARFKELLAAESAVSLNLCQHLVAQIRDLSMRIYEFSTLCVQSRIHAELLRQSEGGDIVGDGVCISPAPKHADFASRIATHREAVSREFSRLAKLGLIERRGADLIITDIERLRKIVKDAMGE